MIIKEVVGLDIYIETVYREIRKDCAKFLRETDFNPMWRGFVTNMSSKGSPVLVKSTIQDRKPRDTLPVIHKILDDWFEKNFGYRYRSDKVMFSTPSISNANSFGHPAMVFPIGDFSYCWSPTVDDLTFILHKMFDRLGLPARPENWDKLEHYKIAIHKALSDSQYRTTGLTGVFNPSFSPEVMIRCDKYYVVVPELLDVIGMTPEAKAKNFMDGLRHAK